MAEKLQVLLRLLWLCFFSVFTVVVGNTVLLAVPQARETLYALANGAGDDAWRFVCFALAYLYWAFTAWFVARLMLSRCFDPDPVGADRVPRYANACARIIPRALGLLASVPLALGLLAVSVLYAAILGALSLGFLLVVWRRRHWFVAADTPPGQDARYYRHVEALSPPAWGFLAFLFAVSWAVFVAVWMAPVQASRVIGSPALLLVALGAWTLVGSMVLSYWPRTRRWPNLMLVPLLLLLAASGTDNHPVARPRADTPVTDWRGTRPGLVAHFDHWMARHRRQEPVILVAVAGGASRAAYWSGLTLARLEDEARASGRRFGANVFLLSAVSGGSLGAAAFVGALAAWPEASQRLSDPLDALLGQDLLAPLVGMLLYPDLVQRFVPLVDALRVSDRSVALEHAWFVDWQAVLAQHPSPTPQAARWWASPLVQPYLDAAEPRLPSLVLNTVRLEDGRRLLQSNLAFDLPEAQDLLGPGFDTHHLTLAGAVHNSARFPYISPAGRVRLPAGDDGPAPVWGHLGDGGYHEASGARTLIDIVERLRLSGRIRADAGQLQACGSDADGAHCDSPVVLVLLDNQPRPWGPDWQRDADGQLRPTDGLQLEKSWPVRELSAPPQGLVAAWGSNTARAERQLAQLAGPGGDRYVELRFPLYALKRQPSMNWHLDAGSRDLLRTASAPLAAGAVPTNLADRALLVNLQRLRGWIASTTP